MPERTCKVCGVVFQQGVGRPAVTCSPECRAEASRQRAKAHFDATYVPHPLERVSPVCSVDGCDGPNAGAGLCPKHRSRMKKYGTVDLPDVPCGLCGRPSGRQGLNVAKAFCKECQPLARAQASVQWRVKNPERLAVLREREVLARYGMTVDDRDVLLAAQNGCCAICHRPYDRAEKRHWHIDHDEESGQVRGVLCRRCNQEIGKFGHDPELLRSAADYLDKARANRA